VKHGTRVRWDDEDPANPERVGTVMEPTEEELAYVATWSPTARRSVQGHVIVRWDGDEEWDRAWCDPDDLQEVHGW
jgi:hypothetical protein